MLQSVLQFRPLTEKRYTVFISSDIVILKCPSRTVMCNSGPVEEMYVETIV
jgi:hypothetical protein